MNNAVMRVCGQQLRVDVRQGKGTGTALLLLSGIGIGYEIFDRLTAALDLGIDLIRVDVPGVGGSPAGLLPAGFPQLATLLTGLLDDLGYRQVDVLGFSWGGALAQQFAVQYPSRCRRLVLMSTSTGVLSIPGEPRVLATMLTPQDFRDPRQAAGVMYGVDPDSHVDDVRQLFGTSAMTSSGLGYLYQLTAVSCWTSLPFLPLIRQPALVMGGDSDPLVPAANARILAALIPHATLHVFSGGHIEPLAAPTLTAPVISTFLAD